MSTNPRLDLTRSQILGFRRRAGFLEERLPNTTASLRRAARAGLQDSMPRAALLSIHARVEGTDPTTLAHPSLVQVWGPRYSAYVVATRDLAVFTVGRLPDDPDAIEAANDLADRLHDLLEGGEMEERAAARALGRHPNSLRYAAPTGRLLIRWDGARQPTLRTVPPPDMGPRDARRELVRRYLHVFGPATAESFAQWAGVRGPSAVSAFEMVRRSVIPVRTPIGEAWILARDEPALRAEPAAAAPARLLPSGDTHFLLQGPDRRLLLPDPRRRAELWTPRVWPGAVLVDGEIVGVWRRAGEVVRIRTWPRLSRARRQAVESEAATMPLPGIDRPIVVRWVDSVDQ